MSNPDKNEILEGLNHAAWERMFRDSIKDAAGRASRLPQKVAHPRPPIAKGKP